MRIKPLIASAVFAALLLSFASASAQAPGDYPRLVIDDQQGMQAPPPGGPFDSTGEFPAFSGQSFVAKVSYTSPGQANNNVFFGLLVSAFQTPLPETLIPPPLFTLPPFTLVQGALPTLNIFGNGSIPLHVPLGLYGIESHVQGVIFDSSHQPSLQLSNGVTVLVDIPDFNVGYSFLLDPPGVDEGTAIGAFGTMQLEPELLSNLKPLGLVNQPLANEVNLGTGEVRFLPIIHNVPDEPTNPLTPPVTRGTSAIGGNDTEITVLSTAGFPTRGRIIIAADGDNNPWDRKTGGGFDPPNAEVVHYDDTSPTAFLGCERIQLGSNEASGNYAANRVIIGEYSAVTTVGARTRERPGTDFTNRDTPHVTVPAFEVDGVTRDIDIYLFEQTGNAVQGFVILDRVTQTWQVLANSLRTTVQGRWDPLVHVAPDGRSFVATQRVSGGVFGWNNRPDELWVFRLDEKPWPATGTTDWQIEYEIGPNPATADIDGVRSRRIYAESIRILNTDPENFVLYAGLAYKFKPTNTQGSPLSGDPEAGFEAYWPREEVIVRDLIECGLVPPGSAKQPPAMPRPYVTNFPSLGNGDTVARFDPTPILSDDRTAMFWIAGSQDSREDAFVVRAATVQSSGEVSRLIVNMSGHMNNVSTSAGVGVLRAIDDGGHGRGRRADFSPNGQRVAWVAQNGNSALTEYLQIGRTSGADFGAVPHVVGPWAPTSVYANNRILTSLRWADNDTVVFMMGSNDSNDPLNLEGASPIEYDLFSYTISTDTMVNLTNTSTPGGPGTGFTSLGKIIPGGSFESESGDFLYYIRGGTSGIASTLPSGTKVANIIGVNTSTLQVFDVTGVEFSGTSLIPDLTLGDGAKYWPIQSATAFEMTDATGVQDGRIFFAGRRLSATGEDPGRADVYVVDTEFPFLAFPVTNTTEDDAVVTNITADPTQGRVAFARTFDANPADSQPSDPLGSNQHLYVVDLDQFLFERDVMSDLVMGGQRFGRVMDGSVHFIPAVGGASSALVFSLGFQVLRVPAFEGGPLITTGIAQVATPIYYSLASVSDPVTEPTPLLIPLVDTLQYGFNYRFYVPSAGPYVGP